MERRLLRTALAVFVVAGLTGAAYRLVVAHGLDTGLSLVGIRHGHSHLMYFGWATPALFVLIARVQRVAPPKRVIWATLGLSVAAFFPFLFWGYEKAQVGSASIPLSVIAASANMIAWYFWVAWYRQNRGGRLLDLSVSYLLLASLAAWLIAAAVPLGLATQSVKDVLAHAFLGWFSEGWFLFGVLGLAYAQSSARPSTWGLWAAGIGTLGSFLFGVPESVLPQGAEVAARLFSALAAVGVLRLVVGWSRAAARGPWMVAILLLAAKAAGMLGAVALSDTWWADAHGMRVLYLHVFVLGFVTLGLAVDVIPERAFRWLATAVAVVLASLVSLTPLWPWAPMSPTLMAWLSLGPPIVVVLLLVFCLRSDQSSPRSHPNP